MAKRKKEKILSSEERFQKEKEQGLEHLKKRIPFLADPAYFFNPGDKVSYGAMKESLVEEVLYGGKVYVLKCIATNHNYGRPYDYETCRVASWVDVRPICPGNDTHFSRNRDVKLDFYNSTVESLMQKHYYFGIDFDPDYQRGYVWEQKDKELLLDSIFGNIDIGKFVLICVPTEEWQERGVCYEVLDGKQRLSALLAFFENRISYKGKYFNDLSGMDKRAFKEHQVSVAEVNAADKKTVLRYFLMLNRTGKSMDEDHLLEVERMLKDMDGKEDAE